MSLFHRDAFMLVSRKPPRLNAETFRFITRITPAVDFSDSFPSDIPHGTPSTFLELDRRARGLRAETR